jgi:hypothetical protein
MTVTPGVDSVRADFKLTNHGRNVWKQGMAFNCFQCGAAPSIRDHDCLRHWVRVDGTLVPHERPLKGGYDPRTSAWYRTAAAAPGPIWTEPSEFNEGRLGITAALAVRTTEAGRVAGVLTADFFLDSLARRLDAIAIDRDTRIAVLTRAGNVVAASWIERSPADAGAWLTPSLTAATTTVAELAVGAAPSWSFDERGTTRLAAMTATRTEGGGEWVVLVSVPEDRFLEGVRGNRRLALALGGVVALVAVALGWMLSRRIAAPLHQVSRQLGRVAQFDLSPTPSPSSRVTEIHELIDTADRMTASLRSFGRYVPTSVVRELLSSAARRLGGRRVELTILFSDVVGFTGISESTEAMASSSTSATTSPPPPRPSRPAAARRQVPRRRILAFFNAPHDVPATLRKPASPRSISSDAWPPSSSLARRASPCCAAASASTRARRSSATSGPRPLRLHRHGRRRQPREPPSRPSTSATARGCS